MGTILRPRKEVSKRGGDDRLWDFPSPSSCCFPFRSLCLLSPKSKHLLARVNARLSWLNRMAGWLEGNIGKFGGKGNVTALGRCWRGRYMVLFSLGLSTVDMMSTVPKVKAAIVRFVINNFPSARASSSDWGVSVCRLVLKPVSVPYFRWSVRNLYQHNYTFRCVM